MGLIPKSNFQAVGGVVRSECSESPCVPLCPVIINWAVKQNSVVPKNTFKCRTCTMMSSFLTSLSHDSLNVSLTLHASISLLQIFMSPLSLGPPFIPSRSLPLHCFCTAPPLSLYLCLPSSLFFYFVASGQKINCEGSGETQKTI